MARAIQSRSRRNIFGWSRKERTAKRKKHAASMTEARTAGHRLASGRSHEHFAEWLERKDYGRAKEPMKLRLGKAFSEGYETGKRRSDRRSRSKSDASDRLKRKREDLAARHLKLREAKIEKAEEKARATVDKAEERYDKGKLDLSDFERIKARMAREIEKQEQFKQAARAKAGNPRTNWGYAVFYNKPGSAYLSQDQVAFYSSATEAKADAKGRNVALKASDPSAYYQGGQYTARKAIRSDATNPTASVAQYRLAQAVLSGTARETHMSPEAAREIVDRTPAHLRSEWAAHNPVQVSSTEYRLGYNLGQSDRHSAQLRKTLDELHATFMANFGPGNALVAPSWQSFEQAYQAGYGGQMGAAAPNPAARRNPETDSEEYSQAKKIAELFHGRPVKEEITVTEQIREHDWLWRIGPLVSLKIRTLTKRNATLPFHQTEEGMVHLFCSPDGKQFYLRGGDQELNIEALGMGQETEWYRDHMLIGEAKEITYRDKKRFHRFKIIDYFHKLGEVTKKKPMLAYDAFAHKMQIVGGQYKVETDDLIDGQSPGIVN